MPSFSIFDFLFSILGRARVRNLGKVTCQNLLIVLLAGLTLATAACRKSAEDARRDLPLPPIGDSGVANGVYYQTEYGFSIPAPARWFTFAGGEDLDELVRFSDPERRLNAGVHARWRYPKERSDAGAWFAEAEKEYEKKGVKAERKSKPEEWPAGPSRWTALTYALKDDLDREWVDTLCVLHRDDLVVWAHLVLSKRDAAGPKGPKLLAAMKESLGGIAWYRPIGPRGISLEHYELLRFSQSFIEACEDRSTLKVVRFLDDASPDREKWIAWYKKIAAPFPKDGKDQAALSVQPKGMVIQEKEATLAFEFVRTEAEVETMRETLAFRLTKAEGNWEIERFEDRGRK